MRKKKHSYGRQALVRNPQFLGSNLVGLLYDSLQPYLIILCKFTLGLVLDKRASTDKSYATLLVLLMYSLGT